MVVFGDSLQDNGNLIKTLNIPGKPFDGGRFSNGKVACEYLLNIISENQKTNIAIDNFAVGGAYTSGKNPKSLLTNHSISVSQQIDRFVAKQIRFNDDDDSFTNQTDKMMMVIHLLNKQISLMTDSLIKSHNLLKQTKDKVQTPLDDEADGDEDGDEEDDEGGDEDGDVQEELEEVQEDWQVLNKS